ncbi:hypothetical protein J8I87_02740 [Paraburkholderia sp. LEh10]|uniref:hypothetical protein n=1 Tax=Paraburkholderia sp. LEh10 TaxID=2821353 RepID=UPI001AE89D51|nr:hypothetical protein [Paraburkholderia sp. LEh10]MBP0588648.1 hypothetical protein [Paraburkholderia sp. LEh10]
MKTIIILCGGALCLSTWQANAQEATTSATATPETVINSEGPGMSTNSMSGSAAMHGKTRSEVYQDLVRSQKDGEQARLQDLFKGGN